MPKRQTPPVVLTFGCAGEPIATAFGEPELLEHMYGRPPIFIHLRVEEVGSWWNEPLQDENMKHLLFDIRPDLSRQQATEWVETEEFVVIVQRQILDAVMASSFFQEEVLETERAEVARQQVSVVVLNDQFFHERSNYTRQVFDSLFPNGLYRWWDHASRRLIPIWHGGEEPSRQPAQDGQPSNPVLNFDLDGLDLSIRPYRCLKRVGIETIGDIVEKSEEELSRIPNFSKKCLEEVKEALEKLGLKLRTPVLRMPVEELHGKTGVRAYNFLKRYGLNTIGDICGLTRLEFHRIVEQTPGVGRKTEEEIVAAVEAKGVKFKDE